MKQLTIIPISVPDAISMTSMVAISSADCVFVQTLEHPFMSWLADVRSNCITMDDIYLSADDFDSLNEKIVERLLDFSGDTAVYAVLGGMGQSLAACMEASSKTADIQVTVMAGAGLCSAAVAAAASAGMLSAASDIASVAANSLTRVGDTQRLLCVHEVNSALVAGEVKLVLSEYYPDAHEVLFALPNKEGPIGYGVEKIPLYMLDRQSGYDAAAVVIVPPLKEEELSRHNADGLMEIMRRLRSPGGCPWDAEQTHETLRTNLIEEAYEVIDAIDRNDPDAICEELGDLLLQIAFHAVIEEERDCFTFRDVATGIVNKLIYRHPHVFADVSVKNSDDVLKNWEELKKKEKGQQTVGDAMDSVPKAFPALMRAYKIQKKAAHVGFDWDDALPALDKVNEEAEEVREAILSNDANAIFDELGDLFFAAVNVARLMKNDPELCLAHATDKFETRFKLMESMILKEELSLKDMTLAEMDMWWDKAKELLKKQ